MNEIQVKHRMLAETLYSMTVSRKLEWKSDEWISGFATVIGNHVVGIDFSSGQFEENDYHVKIYDQVYSEIDSFSDTDISEPDTRPSVGDFKNHYLLLDALYRTVRRQVSGADDALDSILKALSQP